MRIGIMLRAFDEKGGVGVYTRYLTQKLLELDRHNHYVLLYSNPAHVGRFAHHANVTEKVVHAPNKAFWDQVAVPYITWKSRLDVLLHPKFTVPLFAPCKTVMVLHGAGWFIPEHSKFWKSWDLKYINLMMPLYCRKAAAVLSVSQLTTDIYTKLFKLPPGKVKTVYFGPGEHFHRVEAESTRQRVIAKYGLPKRFILTLQRYGDGGRKNIGGILNAYQSIHDKVPHKLVVGGKDCQKFIQDYRIPTDGYGKNIVFPGWIEQEDLPVVYSLADLFLYPSNMEAFPIPITEAMACGTPIITSNQNGLKELAGDAALFVDPRQPQDIAAAIEKLLSSSHLRNSLSLQGLERSKMFSWDKCAKETLAVLENLVAPHFSVGAPIVSGG
jgi:glycosyltransferase involved in cell wall biosynthesis